MLSTWAYFLPGRQVGTGERDISDHIKNGHLAGMVSLAWGGGGPNGAVSFPDTPYVGLWSLLWIVMISVLMLTGSFGAARDAVAARAGHTQGLDLSFGAGIPGCPPPTFFLTKRWLTFADS